MNDVTISLRHLLRESNSYRAERHILHMTKSIRDVISWSRE